MNNIHNNIIYVLDFDGVICDSIDECMIVSYNTFYSTNVFNISEVPVHFKRYFYKNRHYVRPAREYYLVCKAFVDNIELTEFDFINLKKLYESEMIDFEDKFFSKRRHLKDSTSRWLSYHNIYEHFDHFISSITNNIFILTTKDYESVSLLANHYGFINKVEDIFSREISNYKAILFEQLFSKYESLLNSKHIVFVDDNEFHLNDVCKFQVELYFAKWGYAKVQTQNKFKEINTFLELI